MQVECYLSLFFEFYFILIIIIVTFYLKYRYIEIKKVILIIIISSLISNYKHIKQQYNFYLSRANKI